jgi:hypothetical protein
MKKPEHMTAVKMGQFVPWRQIKAGGNWQQFALQDENFIREISARSLRTFPTHATGLEELISAALSSWFSFYLTEITLRDTNRTSKYQMRI